MNWVVNRQSKSINKRNLIYVFIVILIPIILIIIGVCAVCTSQIPNTTITNQQMSNVIEINNNSVDNLIVDSNHIINDRINYLGNAQVGFVSINSICERRICRANQLNVEIVSRRFFYCALLNLSDVPGYFAVTHFHFDAVNGVFSAQTFQSPEILLHLVEWEAMPIGIDEAIEIAFDEKGDNFALGHSIFMLSLSRQLHYWSVHFNSDLQGKQEPEITLLIDNTTGVILANPN